MTEKITITKYPNHKTGVFGAWKYWHLIQFQEDGYKYDLDMTDEGRMKLIESLRKAGNNVEFKINS